MAFMDAAIARSNQLPAPVLLTFALACDGARFNHWRNDSHTKAITLAVTNLTRHYPGVTVYWDQHTNGDELDAAVNPTNFTQVFLQERAATRAWGYEIPIVVLEENGNRHDLQRALGHAR